MSLPDVLFQIVGSYLYEWEKSFMRGEQDCFDHVCAAGYKDLILDFKTPDWKNGFCAAAQHGQLDMMKYLLTLSPINPSCAVFNATVGGYIDCIEFVNGVANFDLIMTTAVQYGHNHVIMKYWDKISDYDTCVKVAIQYNRVGILQFLRSKGAKLPFMGFMVAVECDNMPMIKTIHKNFNYNLQACNQSIHLVRSLNVLLYLYANVGYNATDNNILFLNACKNDDKILMTFLSLMDVQPYDKAVANPCNMSTLKFLATHTKINANVLLENTQSLEVMHYAIELGATNRVEIFYEACVYSNLAKMKLLYTPNVDMNTAYAQFETGLNFSDTTYLEYRAIFTFLISHGCWYKPIDNANTYNKLYDIQLG